MWNLLWSWYGQIWPNLAASAMVSGPLFAWHHRRIKAHITATAAAAPPVQPAVDIRVAVAEELRRAARETGGLR